MIASTLCTSRCQNTSSSEYSCRRSRRHVDEDRAIEFRIRELRAGEHFDVVAEATEHVEKHRTALLFEHVRPVRPVQRIEHREHAHARAIAAAQVMFEAQVLSRECPQSRHRGFGEQVEAHRLDREPQHVRRRCRRHDFDRLARIRERAALCNRPDQRRRRFDAEAFGGRTERDRLIEREQSGCTQHLPVAGEIGVAVKPFVEQNDRQDRKRNEPASTRFARSRHGAAATSEDASTTAKITAIATVDRQPRGARCFERRDTARRGDEIQHEAVDVESVQLVNAHVGEQRRRNERCDHRKCHAHRSRYGHATLRARAPGNPSAPQPRTVARRSTTPDRATQKTRTPLRARWPDATRTQTARAQAERSPDRTRSRATAAARADTPLLRATELLPRLLTCCRGLTCSRVADDSLRRADYHHGGCLPEIIAYDTERASAYHRHHRQESAHAHLDRARTSTRRARARHAHENRHACSTSRVAPVASGR